MKKIAAVAGVLILTIVIVISVIHVQEIETDVTRKRSRVGVIMNGVRQDYSWGQSHYEALEKTADILNLDIVYHEVVPEDERSEQDFRQLVANGCQIIIADSFSYGEWILKVAREHPKLHFFHAAGTRESNNLATYFGRIYQMRYLTGVVAGLQTQTNELGYVAAFPIPEVNRGINAFTLGARAVNPNAKVYVKWCYSWIGDDEAEQAAKELLAEHNIDVLSMHTDSLKVLEIAEASGVWAVGYNRDNSALFPKCWLTAAVWDWEKFYTPRILECLQGKFQGRHYWQGVESGIVSLAPLSPNVKPGISEAVETERRRLQSGLFDVFYGPIRDQNGVLRVAEDESMTDDTMLNDFDWYVDGVLAND